MTRQLCRPQTVFQRGRHTGCGERQTAPDTINSNYNHGERCPVVKSHHIRYATDAPCHLYPPTRAPRVEGHGVPTWNFEPAARLHPLPVSRKTREGSCNAPASKVVTVGTNEGSRNRLSSGFDRLGGDAELGRRACRGRVGRVRHRPSSP